MQETYLRAWRAYERFEGRSSFRVWLHQIATNACLRAAEQRGRRAMPSGLGAPDDAWRDQPVVAAPHIQWIQPAPGRPGRGDRVAPARAAGVRRRVAAPAGAAAGRADPARCGRPAGRGGGRGPGHHHGRGQQRAAPGPGAAGPGRAGRGRARRAGRPAPAGPARPVRRRLPALRSRPAHRGAPRRRDPGDAAAPHLVRRARQRRRLLRRARAGRAGRLSGRAADRRPADSQRAADRRLLRGRPGRRSRGPFPARLELSADGVAGIRVFFEPEMFGKFGLPAHR